MAITLRALAALCLLGCVCAVSTERRHGFLDVDWSTFRSVGTPASPRSGPSAATALKVEYLTNPHGIDTPAPRFSWVPVHPQRAQNQSAYQIQVTGPDGSAVWDSGRVQSSQINQVAYAGQPLSSDSDYFWAVRWWDDAGSAAPWSVPATFSTGLFNSSEWQGSWITAGGVGNQLRKTVSLPFEVARASVFVSGLGYYELYVNGQRVGDHQLDPGWTTYQKRVLYSSYDATSLFSPGSNCIAAVLGRGWYGQENYGNSTLLLQINLVGTGGEAQSIVTDGSWEASRGPIVYDDIYNGEHYDARLETAYADFCSSSGAWSPVAVTAGPGGVMASQTFQPIKKITEIAAVQVTNPQSGYYVVDFGQSLSGWCRLKVKGPSTAGVQITLAHAEILKPDGSGMIYTAELRSAQATDMYTTKGSQSGETYEPRFTYHGFRYVQITGLPYAPDLTTLTAVHIRSSVDTVGQIAFSVPILNQIQHNIFWGQSTNLMSVPTDCDNRDERKGWMGDAALSADEAFHNFDMPALYTNWMNMIQDEQSLDQDGALTDTTPLTFGSRQSDPSWGTAYPTILHGMWKYHGDTTIIRNHFQSLKAYIDWLVSLAQKDFANFYVEYGDWVPPPPFPRVDGSLTSAFSFLHDLIYYADMAAAIGESSEQQRAVDLFATYLVSFNTAFFNQTSGVYLDGLQTGQCLPLWLDIIPSDTKASVVKFIVDDIVKTNNVHLTTGIIGTKFLSLSLSDNGQSNVALALATQTSYPSWGYMITNTIEPATTLWELWNTPTGDPGMDSRDHIMFGSVGHWFYTVLAGIDQTPDSVGFETVQFMPRATVSSLVRSFAKHSAGANASYTEVNNAAIVHGAPLLDWVNATVITARGPVAISWAADGDKLSFAVNVTVPLTSSALVYVPIAPNVDPSTVMVEESGAVVWKGGQFVPGVQGVTAAQYVASTPSGDGPFVQFATGSGSYQFLLTVAALDEALPALQ